MTEPRPFQPYQAPEYSEERVLAYLIQLEGHLAGQDVGWDQYIPEVSREVYASCLATWFSAAGPLYEEYQNRTARTAAALDEANRQAEEAGRWTGPNKLRVAGILLEFSGYSQYFDSQHMDTPHGRAELARLVMFDELEQITDKAKEE